MMIRIGRMKTVLTTDQSEIERAFADTLLEIEAGRTHSWTLNSFHIHYVAGYDVLPADEEFGLEEIKTPKHGFVIADKIWLSTEEGLLTGDHVPFLNWSRTERDGESPDPRIVEDSIILSRVTDVEIHWTKHEVCPF